MAMTLITTNTSSGASASVFTSGIDSTYKLYIFKFYDVNPASDSKTLTVQANASSQSGYNEAITSSFFQTSHNEDDSGTPAVGYRTAADLAQGTDKQYLTGDLGNGGDESGAGELFLFNPSNTTYVKHWYCRTVCNQSNDSNNESYSAGYFNVAAAITNIQFALLDGGDFDAVIKMYGVG